jgi:hypothetical protein
MPEFLHLFANQIKAEMTEEAFKSRLDLSTLFEKNWINATFESKKVPYEILAIDSSSQHEQLSWEGIFYVVRALGVSKGKKYRELFSSISVSPNTTEEPYLLSRKREWIEHKVALKAIDEGFSGYILLDGSIYGREVHLPFETNFCNDRDFMIRYFETFLRLMDICKEKKIWLIGLSKESRSSFFREYLLLNFALEIKDEIGLDEKEIIELFSKVLDNEYQALKKVRSMNNEKLNILVEELLSKKPDFALILRYAQKNGYTVPLLLGASSRWRRGIKQILDSPEAFLNSHFPVCSQNEEFVKNAKGVITKISDMPAIISFHVLPSLNDTPIRVDVPAWCFGIDDKLLDVGWPEKVNVDISNILEIISAGYFGPENYNIWLKAAHDGAKLTSDVFKNLYLRKIMDISGSYKMVRRSRYGEF